ncbi:MAG: type II secretion system major pseudopilin GspG [Candidatus Tectomicrobia bacterium]|nr:type II secretion system major pseudopilin GspG [Candidatus Tectomicrobia bacterium]
MPASSLFSRSQRGITLIELLVVMVILGLLAALVGPRLFGKVEQSKLQINKTQMSLLEEALDRYRLDMGTYPDSLEDLVKRPGGENSDRWEGSYLKKGVLPRDPWNHEYTYSAGEDKRSYCLESKGPDGNAIKECGS